MRRTGTTKCPGQAPGSASVRAYVRAWDAWDGREGACVEKAWCVRVRVRAGVVRYLDSSWDAALPYCLGLLEARETPGLLPPVAAPAVRALTATTPPPRQRARGEGIV